MAKQDFSFNSGLSLVELRAAEQRIYAYGVFESFSRSHPKSHWRDPSYHAMSSNPEFPGQMLRPHP